MTEIYLHIVARMMADYIATHPYNRQAYACLCTTVRQAAAPTALPDDHKRQSAHAPRIRTRPPTRVTPAALQLLLGPPSWRPADGVPKAPIARAARKTQPAPRLLVPPHSCCLPPAPPPGRNRRMGLAAQAVAVAQGRPAAGHAARPVHAGEPAPRRAHRLRARQVHESKHQVIR